MRVGLLAEKIGMTRFYDKYKINHSVTVLQVKECKVACIKSSEKHGYNSVTLTHGITNKSISKPFKGFLKINNLKAFSKCKEFRVSNINDMKVGDNIDVSNFSIGQYIDVTSNSKGKGFAGGMKRHNFSGNRATHGVSISHRSHGSTGQCQDPGKVFKGKKMAGRLGNKKVTIQNLKLLNIDIENNLLIVKGAVPGHKGSIITVLDSVKNKQDKKNNKIEEKSAKMEEKTSKTDDKVSKVEESKNNQTDQVSLAPKNENEQSEPEKK